MILSTDFTGLKLPLKCEFTVIGEQLLLVSFRFQYCMHCRAPCPPAINLLHKCQRLTWDNSGKTGHILPGASIPLVT